MGKPIETQSWSPAVIQGGEEEPEEEIRSAAPLPCVTIALLTVNILIFLAMWALGKGDVSSMSLAFGNKNTALIHAGQTWRLLTPIFLHAGLLHLFVNSLSLVMLGIPMEQM